MHSSFKSSSTSSLSSCSSQTQLKKGYFHGNSPFYYLHLQQLLYGQIRVEKIFDELLELIQHALMALYVLPQLSQNKLLALLYMLEEFMIISPIRSVLFLGVVKSAFFSYIRIHRFILDKFHGLIKILRSAKFFPD